MLPYLAHLPCKAHDSHFNQEHKMFELQMLIERLTVLFDNSGSHQLKLGAKFIFEKGEIKCMASNHSFNFSKFYVYIPAMQHRETAHL